MLREQDIEQEFINKLIDLKYIYRPDITDRVSLEQNFRQKFEELNKVSLTDSEFARLLEEIITPDVFTASKTLREYNTFQRDDGTPLTYSLVNIKDWCKNTFEVINQLRINTYNSHQRYDVLLLIILNFYISKQKTAGKAIYDEFKNLCVWNKDNGGMGAFYRSKHELVFIFKNGTEKHINNFGLGETGRYRTNVWDYPSANSFANETREKIKTEKGRVVAVQSEEIKFHPTCKPVRMVSELFQ